MRLGLSSLLRSVLNLPYTPPRKNVFARRGRRLLGEQLETRYALAGEVLLAEDPLPDVDLSAVPAIESAPLADPATVQSDPSFVQPGDPPPVQPPNSTGGNFAPTISGFSLSSAGNWITLQGLVMDDQDPTGYTVNFTGVIAVSVTVDVDNTFRYIFQVAPDTSGTIFAQTQDSLGLWSNIASVNI